MIIIVKYICDNREYEYNSFNDIININAVTEIDCSWNKLKSLPNGLIFPNLIKFDCSNNEITILPNNMRLPKLLIFYCHCNKLMSLPDNIVKLFPKLQRLNCSWNYLNLLPNNIDNFSKLQYLWCNNNNLTSISLPIIDKIPYINYNNNINLEISIY
jgi:Leucine-rich repeat (LRR) protein